MREDSAVSQNTRGVVSDFGVLSDDAACENDAVCWLPLASSVRITGSKSKIQIEIRFQGIVFSRKARNLDKSTLMLICIPQSSSSPQGDYKPKTQQLRPYRFFATLSREATKRPYVMSVFLSKTIKLRPCRFSVKSSRKATQRPEHTY